MGHIFTKITKCEKKKKEKIVKWFLAPMGGNLNIHIQKIHTHLPFDSDILILGSYPKVQNDLCKGLVLGFGSDLAPQVIC